MREFKGSFQIARKIIESDIFFDKPAEWFKIWVFILAICNHKDNGRFKKGECLTSYKEIAEYTKTNRYCVDNFIRWAKRTTQITTRKTTRRFYISILNYAKYQDFNTYKTTPKTTPKTKLKRNTNDTIIKNDNNDKNNNADFAAVVDFFFKKTEQLKGFKPAFTGQDGKLLKLALKRYPPDKLKEFIEFYLNSEKADKLGITLSIALSAHSINLYQQKSQENSLLYA